MNKKFTILATTVLLMGLASCKKEPIVTPESSASEITTSQSTDTSKEPVVESSAEHEHSWGEATVTKEATHTEEGEKTKTCLICGEAVTEKISKTEGHTFGEWTTTKEATCTEDGEKQRTCACGEKETETIASTGHDFGEWTTIAEATHTTEGFEQRQCKNCGEKENQGIPKTTDHEWGDWTTTKEATCTENGIKTRTCACGDTDSQTIAAPGHDWGEWSTIPSTCQVKGYEKRTCKNCGLNDTKSLDTFGDHDWSEWVVDTEVTCTTDGERHRMCSTCHKIEKETLTAPGHKTYMVGNKDTHDTICSTCSEVLKSEPHDLSGDPFEVIPATCTTKGGSWYKCKVCSAEVFVSNMTAPGHNYVYTYTDSGHTKTCSSCGDTISSDHNLFGTQYCEECGWFAGTDVQIGTQFHVDSTMTVVRFTSPFAHDIALKTDDVNDFGRLRGGFTGYAALTNGQSYKTGVEAKKAVYLDVSGLAGKDVTIQYVRHDINDSGACRICQNDVATTTTLRQKFNFNACSDETLVYKFSNTTMNKKVALVTDLAYKRSYLNAEKTWLSIEEPEAASDESKLDSTGRYFSFSSSKRATWYLKLASNEELGGSLDAYLSPVIYDTFSNIKISDGTVTFTALALLGIDVTLNFGLMLEDGTVKYFRTISCESSSEPGKGWIDQGEYVDVSAKLTSTGTVSESDFTNAIAFYKNK